jgi:hypothetical protein
MNATTTDTFTMGVFKDALWANRGVEALEKQGFPRGAISVIARESPEGAALLGKLGLPSDQRIDVPQLGSCMAGGPLVRALEGDTRELTSRGLAASVRLAGFQPHDGRIFETLVERGGILVAVLSEPRAADALAILHAYGGANAAIGAWHGRV